MALTWVATDHKTGRLLADLRDLECDRVSSVVGAYTTATARLPVPTAPEGWQRATLPGASVLVLLDDNVPLWGGVVTRRARGLGDAVELSLATAEAYLDRRYVGDFSRTGASQTSIAAGLVSSFATGWPLRVEAAPSAVLRDRAYEDRGDKTVLSALTELSGVQGGPEWTITWEWVRDPERIIPVFRVADRIGSPVPDGLGPAATFEAPGPVADATLVEDYGDGKGATDVMAVSSGSVDERPQSPRQVASGSERPPFEERFTPSTSITEVSTLTEHAREALSRMASGATALTLVADMATAPRLHRDWWAGDDVGYRVQAPAFPDGLEGVARCIGWEIDLTGVPTVAPILATED